MIRVVGLALGVLALGAGISACNSAGGTPSATQKAAGTTTSTTVPTPPAAGTPTTAPGKVAQSSTPTTVAPTTTAPLTPQQPTGRPGTTVPATTTPTTVNPETVIRTETVPNLVGTTLTADTPVDGYVPFPVPGYVGAEMWSVITRGGTCTIVASGDQVVLSQSPPAGTVISAQVIDWAPHSQITVSYGAIVGPASPTGASAASGDQMLNYTNPCSGAQELASPPAIGSTYPSR
jgi:hypothetical protein